MGGEAMETALVVSVGQGRVVMSVSSIITLRTSARPSVTPALAAATVLVILWEEVVSVNLAGLENSVSTVQKIGSQHLCVTCFVGLM
jgi:hypothetical protein